MTTTTAVTMGDTCTACDLPSDLPMVWITQGKTDHAAYILKIEDDGRRLVKWAASELTQWVPADAIVKTELPKRRRRRPPTGQTEYHFQLGKGANHRAKEKATSATSSTSTTAATNDAATTAVKQGKKRPRKHPKEHAPVVAAVAKVEPPQVKKAVEPSKSNIGAASADQQNEKYPIGTKVHKEFPPFGWFSGTVVGHTQRWWYQVQYEDDDSEEMTEKELDKIVVRDLDSDEEDDDAEQTAGEATSPEGLNSAKTPTDYSAGNGSLSPSKRPSSLRPKVTILPRRDSTLGSSPHANAVKDLSTSEDSDSDDDAPIALLAKKKKRRRSEEYGDRKKPRLGGDESNEDEEEEESGEDNEEMASAEEEETAESDSEDADAVDPNNNGNTEAKESGDNLQRDGAPAKSTFTEQASTAEADASKTKKAAPSDENKKDDNPVSEGKNGEYKAAKTGSNASSITEKEKSESPNGNKNGSEGTEQKPVAEGKRDAAKPLNSVEGGASNNGKKPDAIVGASQKQQNSVQNTAVAMGTGPARVIHGRPKVDPKEKLLREMMKLAGTSINPQATNVAKEKREFAERKRAQEKEKAPVGANVSSTTATVPVKKIPAKAKVGQNKNSAKALGTASVKKMNPRPKVDPKAKILREMKKLADTSINLEATTISREKRGAAKEQGPNGVIAATTGTQEKAQQKAKGQEAQVAASVSSALDIMTKNAVASIPQKSPTKPVTQQVALKPSAGQQAAKSTVASADKAAIANGSNSNYVRPGEAQVAAKPGANSVAVGDQKTAVAVEKAKSAEVATTTAQSTAQQQVGSKATSSAAHESSAGKGPTGAPVSSSSTAKPVVAASVGKGAALPKPAVTNGSVQQQQSAVPIVVAPVAHAHAVSAVPIRKPAAPALVRKSRRIRARKDKEDTEDAEEEGSKSAPAKTEPQPEEEKQQPTEKSKRKVRIDKRFLNPQSEKSRKKQEERGSSEEESSSSDESSSTPEAAAPGEDFEMTEAEAYTAYDMDVDSLEDGPKSPAMDKLDLATMLISMHSFLPRAAKEAAKDSELICQSAISEEDEKKLAAMEDLPGVKKLYPRGTCCTVCGQHIEALVEKPVDWSRPLHAEKNETEIDAIIEHTTECHNDAPLWNVLEATHKLEFEDYTDVPITPVAYVKLALRHAVSSSYCIDEDLLDMTKLRDMFIRRLGIARGFIRWSSDSFLEGRKFVNCGGQSVTNAELRRSSLLLLAYLEEHVLEHAFEKSYHLTEEMAHSMPFLRWRNMVQNIFLDPNGVENAWFMQDENNADL